jgi:threonine dehydratase
MEGWSWERKMFGIDDVRAAAGRIDGLVCRTPVLRYKLTTPAGEATLLVKPECLQPIGAFKLRGAFSYMTTLPGDCPGVVTHSSGNHAQAVARAAKVLGLKAVVVMPDNAPALKKARTEADGACVEVVGPDSEERRERAEAISREQGLVLVPPYDHPLVAAGQGTAALELLADVGSIDRLFCPVSGGGLLSGCAEVVATMCPEAEIVGVEPEAGNDVALSLAAGRRVSVPPPETIADGLRVRIPGSWTWSVLQRRVHRVALVSDDELRRTMAWALFHLRVVLEPSGAASLAVALREGVGRVGVILSGGNVEPSELARVVSEYQA